MVSHVDLATHKTSNFPEDVKARIDAMAAAHKRLPLPPQVGHKIGIPRKEVILDMLLSMHETYDFDSMNKHVQNTQCLEEALAPRSSKGPRRRHSGMTNY